MSVPTIFAWFLLAIGAIVVGAIAKRKGGWIVLAVAVGLLGILAFGYVLGHGEASDRTRSMLLSSATEADCSFINAREPADYVAEGRRCNAARVEVNLRVLDERLPTWFTTISGMLALFSFAVFVSACVIHILVPGGLRSVVLTSEKRQPKQEGEDPGQGDDKPSKH